MRLYNYISLMQRHSNNNHALFLLKYGLLSFDLNTTPVQCPVCHRNAAILFVLIMCPLQTWTFLFNTYVHVLCLHYWDVIVGAMVSQITSLTTVYSTVYSGADQRKKSKLRVTGLCEGNSPVTGEFPAQRASNAEHVSIWWRHHGQLFC